MTVLLLERVGERQDVDGGIGEMEGVYILWRSLFICIFVHVNQMSANDAIGWTRQSIASIAYFTCMSGFHMHGPLGASTTVSSLKIYDVCIFLFAFLLKLLR